MNSPSPLIDLAAPWLQRASAYGFLAVAALAAAVAVTAALGDWNEIVASLHYPLTDFPWMLALAAPAAVVGAMAVHRPFMRALRAGSLSAVHYWTFAGLLAAHAAYVTMNAAQYMMWESFSGYRLYFTDSLGNAIIFGLMMGAVSLLFGLLPTALVALAFAEFMLKMHKGNNPSQYPTEIQSILKGAHHA